MSKKEILQFLKKTIANSHKVCDNSKCNIEVWLSLVEHHVRDVGVASSNLVTSTKQEKSELHHQRWCVRIFCL